MKKTLLLALAIVMSLGAFAQSKYPSKVVVLFLGEKNATFDESKFPDCKFYYTPGIKGEVEKVESLAGKAFGAAGVKTQGMDYKVTYSGSPAEAYSIPMGGGTFFDKNGIISGMYKTFDNVCTSPKKNLQGVYDFENYNVFSKDFVKKGKTLKKAKKAPKKPKTIFDYCGLEMPVDFEVQDAAGKKTKIKDLVKGEPLTLLYVLYLKPDYNFKAGMESGAKKSGKKYINDVLNTGAGIKRLKTLIEIEESIFGHRVVW